MLLYQLFLLIVISAKPLHYGRLVITSSYMVFASAMRNFGRPFYKGAWSSLLCGILIAFGLFILPLPGTFSPFSYGEIVVASAIWDLYCLLLAPAMWNLGRFCYVEPRLPQRDVSAMSSLLRLSLLNRSCLRAHTWNTFRQV